MNRLRSGLLIGAISLGAAGIALLFFAPQCSLWRGLDYPLAWHNPEVNRAVDTLRQTDDPRAPAQDPSNRVIEWRLLLPSLAHVLHVPPLVYLGLPPLGCLIVLGLIAHVVLRETGSELFAFMTTLLSATTSWFFISTGWLAYFDSWYVLGLLVVAFVQPRLAVFAACLFCPWIDERFVLALPAALAVRRDCLRFPWSAFLPEAALCLGSAGLYVLLRVFFLVRGDVGSASHIAHHLGYTCAATTLLHGVWQSLRGLWVGVLFYVGCLLRKQTLWGTAVGFGILATLAINLRLAEDLSRSASSLLPAAVFGIICGYRTLGPLAARLVVAALLAMNLLTPAYHVVTMFSRRIPTLFEASAEFGKEPAYRDPKKNAEHLLALAIALYRAEDFNSARRRVEHSLRFDPDSGASRNLHGLILMKQGDEPGARAEFDEAVRLSPLAPESYINRGTLRRMQGDLRGALEDLRMALELAGDQTELRRLLERDIAALRKEIGT